MKIQGGARLGRLAFFFIAALLALAAPAEARWKYRVTPVLKNDSIYYFNSIPNTEQFRSNFHAELNAVYSWNKWFKAVLQPVGDFDPTAKLSDPPKAPAINALTATEKNSERVYYDLREAYMQFRARPFTFTVGNQIFSWGVTDGFSPTDVVNPRRFVSPLSVDKIGTPAATLGVVQGDFVFELIYIPSQRPSVLPGEDSRWLPRSIYVSRAYQGYDILVPNNVQYYYIHPEILDNAQRHNFGGRIRGQIGSLDLSAIYFEGASNSPAVNIALTASAISQPTSTQNGSIRLNPPLGLMPVYYKHRIYGGTLVYTVGEFILKGESAFTKQISVGTGKALPGNYNQSVLSVEHDFPVPEGKLTAIAQATYCHFETPSENGTTSISRAFDQALVFGLRYAPEEKWSIVNTALWDTKYGGTTFVLNGEYKLRDNLTADLSASLMGGPELSPLGTYRKNSLAAASLRYDF